MHKFQPKVPQLLELGFPLPHIFQPSELLFCLSQIKTLSFASQDCFPIHSWIIIVSIIECNFRHQILVRSFPRFLEFTSLNPRLDFRFHLMPTSCTLCECHVPMSLSKCNIPSKSVFQERLAVPSSFWFFSISSIFSIFLVCVTSIDFHAFLII